MDQNCTSAYTDVVSLRMGVSAMTEQDRDKVDAGANQVSRTNSRVNPTPRNGIPSARQGFRLYQGVKGVITLYMVGHDPPLPHTTPTVPPHQLSIKLASFST